MTDHERGPQVDERALEAGVKAAWEEAEPGIPYEEAKALRKHRGALGLCSAYFQAGLRAYLSAVEARPVQEPVGILHICEECGTEYEELRPVDSGTRLYAAPVELDGLKKELGAYQVELTRTRAELTRTQAQLEEAVRLLEIMMDLVWPRTKKEFQERDEALAFLSRLTLKDDSHA